MHCDAGASSAWTASISSRCVASWEDGFEEEPRFLKSSQRRFDFCCLTVRGLETSGNERIMRYNAEMSPVQKNNFGFDRRSRLARIDSSKKALGFFCVRVDGAICDEGGLSSIVQGSQRRLGRAGRQRPAAQGRAVCKVVKRLKGFKSGRQAQGTAKAKSRAWTNRFLRRKSIKPLAALKRATFLRSAPDPQCAGPISALLFCSNRVTCRPDSTMVSFKYMGIAVVIYVYIYRYICIIGANYRGPL